MLYYYKDGSLTIEEPIRGRVETNKNFRDFSVSISNVSKFTGADLTDVTYIPSVRGRV